MHCGDCFIQIVPLDREVQNPESSVKDLKCAVGFGVMDHASYIIQTCRDMDIKQDTEIFK
jgi:hypothetical protein